MKRATTIWILLLLLFGFLLLILFFSTGNYGESDSIQHYLISRYAFKHPELFLHYWGKPFFTTISASFSQFGYYGMKIFNILAGLTAAYFAYRIAEKLNYKNTWLVLIITIFTPVYTIYLYTGLTEPLFSLILVGSIFLFLDKRYLFSIILISFIPFVRMEGLMYFPFYFIALILYRKYKYIPLLAFGTIVYTILGYFVYQDLFWLINSLPYQADNTVYGSGDFWIYFVLTKRIFGYPVAVLAILGIILLFFQAFKKKQAWFKSSVFFELYFILGMSLAFFIGHSLMWWMGAMAVLASDRLMVCIIPLVAILALKGYNLIETFVIQTIRWAYMRTVVLAIILIPLLIMPFIVHSIPTELVGVQKMIKRVSEWLKESSHYDSFISYFDPLVPYYLDLDPYDALRSKKVDRFQKDPYKQFPDGSILIWDGHYAPYEGELGLDSLMETPYFQLIKVFAPKKPHLVLPSKYYRVCLFKKGAGFEYLYRSDTIAFYDYEEILIDQDRSVYIDTISSHGNYSYLMDATTSFSPSYQANLKDFKLNGDCILRGSVKIFPVSNTENILLSLVVSTEINGVTDSWYMTDLNPENCRSNQWNTLIIDANIYYSNPENHVLKVFIWNKGRCQFIMDEFLISRIQ